MCTLSRAWTPTGYVLFFNRDERKTRLPALPPARHDSGGTAYLAPIDADSGGTWIAVNEHGLTAAILNHYECAYTPDPATRRSRGLLLVELAGAHSVDGIFEQLKTQPLTIYPPFYLAVQGAEKPLAFARWDGCELTVTENAELPLTTSSFEPEAVVTSRQARYRELVSEEPTPEQLEAFQRSRHPRGDAHSVCMLREDAETVSLTTIEVSRAAVTLCYRAKVPGTFEFDAAETLTLPRKP